MSQSLDLLSFFGGIASIVGLFLAIWGGKKISRYLRQSTKATAQGGGNVAAPSAQTMTGNIIVSGDFIAASVEDVRALLARAPTPPPTATTTTDEKEAALRRALEELIARPDASVSSLLIAAHKLAKHRGDKAALAWIEREMDGYSQADVAKLAQDETSHRLVKGYFLAAIGGGRVMDFPLTLFEAKSASQLEAVIAEFRMAENPPSTEIALPRDMREFFEKERFSVPPKVRFFTEVAQLGRILAAVRVRVLTYIRSLP